MNWKHTPSQVTPNVDSRLNHHERKVWELVSLYPLTNLWNLQGAPVKVVAKRTFQSMTEDRLFGHAAELAFYFLFALFPALVSASAILGLVARSAHHFYGTLLHYLAIVLPQSALGMVMQTFNQTAAASTSGKLTFGLLAAIWSASVGISAVQDTLNGVYKLVDRRSYFRARLAAIGLTAILVVTLSLCLGSMLAGDAVALWAKNQVPDPFLREIIRIAARTIGWGIAACLLALSFSLTYFWAPDRTRCHWHWMTPGTALGIVGWLAASFGLRLYLYYFNNYSVTYGSLGAVIILLTWFYITGLMLLIGAELDSEIEAAAVERRITGEATVPEHVKPAA